MAERVASIGVDVYKSRSLILSYKHYEVEALPPSTTHHGRSNLASQSRADTTDPGQHKQRDIATGPRSKPPPPPLAQIAPTRHPLTRPTRHHHLTQPPHEDQQKPRQTAPHSDKSSLSHSVPSCPPTDAYDPSPPSQSPQKSPRRTMRPARRSISTAASVLPLRNGVAHGDR